MEKFRIESMIMQLSAAFIEGDIFLLSSPLMSQKGRYSKWDLDRNLSKIGFFQ